MNLAEKFKSFDEEEVNEGSLLNFMDIDGLKPEMKKLMALLEKAHGKREKAMKAVLDLQKDVNKALAMAKKIKESDFPANTNDGGGKSNTEYVLKSANTKLDDAFESLNIRIS